jgi:glyoxylase-like metal-dependent hydrolase (beta-lactamase superfamily II)
MIIQVGDHSGIFCIDNAGPARVYYVASEHTVIDTGLPGNVDKILSGLAQIGVSPLEVKRIILTHHHPDHVGNLFELKKRTGSQVVAHSLDAEYISGRRQRRAPKPVVGKLLFEMMSITGIGRVPNVDVDRMVEDGDEMNGFKVIHTPGHTPGHICLLYGKYLFSGDLLRATPGAFEETPHLFTGDVQLARASVGKVAQLEFESLLSSHHPPYAFGATEKVRELAIKLGTLQ